MKKVLMLLPSLFLAVPFLQAQDDAIVRFFDKYMEDERFTVVYVSPKLFEMVAKIDTDDEDWQKVRPMVADLRGLRVLTSDSISDGLALYKEAMSKIPTKEYTDLLTVRDGKEHVRIWVKEKGNVIDELLLLVGAPDEFVLLSLSGKIDLDKVSNLSKTLDVEGAQHLEKIKKGN
jgi:hypothetical protein